MNEDEVEVEYDSFDEDKEDDEVAANILRIKQEKISSGKFNKRENVKNDVNYIKVDVIED